MTLTEYRVSDHLFRFIKVWFKYCVIDMFFAVLDDD